MEYNFRDLRVTVTEDGAVTIKEGKDEIFLGESSGRRFKTAFRALKMAEKISELNDVISEVGE